MLFDIDREALDLSVGELAATGIDVLAKVVDVADEQQMTDGFAATVGHFGGLDYVCNNAAMQTWQPAFPHADLADVRRVIDVNVSGVVLGCQLAFDHMATSGGGSVVITASGAGKVPLPSDPLYSATKAAVVMLTRAAAPSFADAGIRLNAVCPGFVDTAMLTKSVVGLPEFEAALEHAPTLTPQEVAIAIVDLATNPDQTGQTPSIIP